MKKIIRIAAGTLATAAITIGGMAATAPAAQAYSTGSATRTEARKVLNEADKQRCLTRTEVRRYTKAHGTYIGDDEWGMAQYVWKGTGSVRFLAVTFDGSCADSVVASYTNNRAAAWFYFDPTDEN